MSGIQKGYPWYGQKIGVLVFDGESPRIKGDPGHADTFAYPVRYGVVQGSFAALIDGSDQMEKRLIQAASALKKEGVQAVVGDCGLMSLYQCEVAAQADLLFAGSALCLIPSIWQMMGKSGTIGIITGHSQYLHKGHLKNAGWQQDIPLAIVGMEDKAHFREIVLLSGSDLCCDKLKDEVAQAARQLVENHTDIKAIIIECSNLASYSSYVAQQTGLPVFDIVSAANLLNSAIVPKDYNK